MRNGFKNEFNKITSASDVASSKSSSSNKTKTYEMDYVSNYKQTFILRVECISDSQEIPLNLYLRTNKDFSIKNLCKFSLKHKCAI